MTKIVKNYHSPAAIRGNGVVFLLLLFYYYVEPISKVGYF
jgi:hypothetical protein